MTYDMLVLFKEAVRWPGFRPFFGDHITFDSLEEAKKFRNGEAAFDYLDNAVRLKEGEICVSMTDEKKTLIWENEEVKEPLSLHAGIKEWYVNTFPDDELGKQMDSFISFEQLFREMEKGEDVYICLGEHMDSLIRERVFTELSKRKGLSYDKIYDLWLEGGRERRSKLLSDASDKKPKIEVLIRDGEDVVKNNASIPEKQKKSKEVSL